MNCQQREANERYLECDQCRDHAAALRMEKLKATWKDRVNRLEDRVSAKRSAGEPVRLGDLFKEILDL